MSDRAEAGEVMIEADDLPAVFDADRRAVGVGDQVARGVGLVARGFGISKTRRFVATRGSAPQYQRGHGEAFVAGEHLVKPPPGPPRGGGGRRFAANSGSSETEIVVRMRLCLAHQAHHLSRHPWSPYGQFQRVAGEGPARPGGLELLRDSAAGGQGQLFFEINQSVAVPEHVS